jgi:murein DD-endopeptidase MepM/ murein hydrolase activator NlpD
MSRITRFLPLCFLLAACTQAPAHVEYRGSNFYGREHEVALDSPVHETYPSTSERYKPGFAHPVEPAEVPSVGVSELAPLSPSALVQASSAPRVTGMSVASDSHGRFIWPVNGGKVISHFGPKPQGRTNDGINIAIAEGEPIIAAADGMVVYAGNELKGYGNMIILRHDDGWMTAYAHARDISVKKNDYVKQGELIGYVGLTGGVKTPQLHFALRNGKTPVDPEQHLPHNVAGMQ